MSEPTPNQIRSEPAGPTIDGWVAEMMGWQRFDKRPVCWPPTKAIFNMLTGETLEPFEGPWWLPPGIAVEGTDGGCEFSDYSTDPALIHTEIEPWIERQGLEEEYATALWKMLPAEAFPNIASQASEWWAIRRASPLDCCRAVLLAKGGQG